MFRTPLRIAAGGSLLLAAMAVAPATSTATPAQAPTAAKPTPVAPESPALKAAEQSRAARTASALRLAGGEKLIVKSVIEDADGSTHVRYERTYDGLRVVGGDLISHKDAQGTVEQVTWNVRKAVKPASMTPRVTKQAARKAGLTASSARQEKAAVGELVVFQAASGPRLAYDVVTEGVLADQSPSRAHAYIDARTGKLLGSQEDIKSGTGNSQYSGQVSVGTTQSGSTYQLKDSVGNYVTDLNGAAWNSTSTGTLFTDADDVWGNGSTSSRQTAAVDAQYGAEKTYDFYDTQLGRRGIWNNGTGARSRVHVGNGWSNANWDGTQMNYGDGANNAKPLTELDVAAHEMTHGVTENTANLDYGNPDAGIYVESGGLNEATSDIFAAGVEFYANNSSDPGDYLVGEKIDIRGNGTPLRYMDKPSKDGKSQDCYNAQTGSIDPHYSSGPLNHWFFLASEGSGAKTVNGVSYDSPTCGGAPAVTAIGRDKALKIWYRTLSTYLTSSSKYANARTGAIKAAKDLYGASSAECKGVEAAFTAIAVPAGTEKCDGGTTPPEPTGGALTNGGFESGQTGWTGTSGPITNDTGRPAHSGSWKLWLGGNGAPATEKESQSFAVPATATSPTLTYWIRIDTAESGTTAYDTAAVKINGTTKHSYSNASTPKATWVQKTIDLTAYKGTTVTLELSAVEDQTLQTSFVIDDVVTSF